MIYTLSFVVIVFVPQILITVQNNLIYIINDTDLKMKYLKINEALDISKSEPLHEDDIDYYEATLSHYGPPNFKITIENEILFLLLLGYCGIITKNDPYLLLSDILNIIFSDLISP